MMRAFAAVFLAVLTLLGSAPVFAGPTGTITFVDGTKTECEVLYKHPACDRLVVRSLKNSTLQTFPYAVIHSIEAAGKTKTYNDKRALTADEKAERETNALWGDEVAEGQLGRYAKQTWKDKPVMVWARPGETGTGLEPANWLDANGKPYTKSPWEEMELSDKKKGNSRYSKPARFDGDVLLPAADTQYSVLQPGNRDYLGEYEVRHLTIERNAAYRIRYTLHGNVWVKDGGDLGEGTQTGGFYGQDKDTFARFCGLRWKHKKTGPEAATVDISHWVHIKKGDTGSLEIIGETGGAGDRVTMMSGTLIISENSYLGNGPRASFYTAPGTTTIFLDGARAGCQHKVQRDTRATYAFEGNVMIGTPEHPITRDFYLRCGLYEMENMKLKGASVSTRGSGASLLLGEKGRLEVNSKDPKTARLVICPFPEDTEYSSYAIGKRAKGREMPTGINAVLQGETNFNGVLFDGFHEGGIAVNSSAKGEWKNVQFGKANKASPEKLFQSLE